MNHHPTKATSSSHGKSRVQSLLQTLAASNKKLYAQKTTKKYVLQLSCANYDLPL
jgi:hypothetical protein